MEPFDCWMCQTKNCWYPVDTHIKHIEIAVLHLIIVWNESHTHYWHPILCSQGLSFASKTFVASQFWINLYPHYQSQVTQLNYIPALSASNLRHVDIFTSFWVTLLNVLTSPHPAPTPRFPWHTIRNFNYLNLVYPVCVENCTVGYMHECNSTVMNQTQP